MTLFTFVIWMCIFVESPAPSNAFVHPPPQHMHLSQHPSQHPQQRIHTNGGYTNPVIHHDNPDPGVAYDSVTKKYWLASTSGDAANKFPLFHSTNLINWTAAGHVFPDGSAGTPSWTKSDFWAPELHYVQGRWVVYFVARNSKGMLSVGVAVSHSGAVAGPYSDIGTELVTTDNMGMIDPTYYYENNTSYLVWKEDGNDPAHCPHGNCPTRIFLSPLDAAGTKVLYPRDKWVVLIQQSQSWEGPLVEAPWIIKSGTYYYLFYSANGYSSSAYAVGVARSSKLLGPWSKYPGNPILHTGSGVPFYGPGHCSVVNASVSHVGESESEGESDSTTWAMVHHAWNKDGTGRNVLVYVMAWTPDLWPVVATPSVGPFPPP